VGIVLGWLGNVFTHVRNQRQIARRIGALGGTCAYDNLLSDRLSPVWANLTRNIVDEDTFAHVVGVSFNFYHNDVVSDDDLALLASIPRLRFVDLCGPGITNNGLAHFTKLSQLKRLNLYETRVTATGISESPIAMLLEELRLGGSTANDASLEQISRLSNLRSLTIHRAPGITDAGMAHVANVGRLEVLEIYKTSITDQGLTHLRGLRHLRELTLNSSTISDSGLNRLTDLKELKRLSFQDTPISDLGIAELSKLHGVEEINLWSTNVTDDGIPYLAGFRQLRRLNMFGTAVTDAGMRKLASLKTLEWLQVGPNVTFDEAQELQRSIPKCRVDVVDNTKTIHQFHGLSK